MDPQQELFTALRQALISEFGDIVYDGFLPPEGTPYPFIYLADSRMLDEQNKTGLFARVTQTIHVYSNTPKKRGTLSEMLGTIKSIARHIEHTQSFGWMVIEMEQRILPDDTTDIPLTHGIITVTYRCS
ncbi:MAG: hypothetical protein IJL97_03750 [Lachnospiraceae bacterium]|nr:hypothetical protein [Clostridia bacterium]MBR0085645.1 hypothetical protein [Lachnospiraceae bacterium]